MINKEKKAEIVAEMTESFARMRVAFFGRFPGISVGKMQTLRRTLKKDNAEFKIARKTLIDRALSATGSKVKTQEFEGEIGVVFGYGDEALPAKTLLKFSKENETFQVVSGLLGTRLMSQKDVIALAKLPGREILLGQVASALAGPMRGLAGALQANIRNIAIVLAKVRDQKA